MKVLLVEDDRAAIEVLGFVISKRFPNCAVSFAYDGEMGLQAFKEQMPEIVVTDINMPKMDGLKLAEAIKSISPGTKIIVVTAYSDRIHEENFREIGISQHILKPVQFDKLFAALNKIIEEIRLERQ